jgi:hypothetical protein
MTADPVYMAPGVVRCVKADLPPSRAEIVPFRLAKMKSLQVAGHATMSQNDQTVGLGAGEVAMVEHAIGF